MKLKLTERANLDMRRYDSIIEASRQSVLYASSEYLDIVCKKKWSCLVSDDYEMVMPVMNYSIAGMKGIFQPMLCQQLGVYAKNILTATDLAEIEFDFPLHSYRLHVHDYCKNIFPDTAKSNTRINYELKLEADYPTVKSAYSENTLRNIKKAERAGCEVVEVHDVALLLSMKQTHSKHKIKPGLIHLIKQLCNDCLLRNTIQIVAVFNQQKQPLAICAFIFFKSRVYYLFASSSDEGKKLGAAHFLIESFIKKHSGKKLTLDFEGSMIEGVARFYKGFGAQPKPYYELSKGHIWKQSIIRFLG
jgi:hypothetical protein